jgi:hypothetical protein
MKYLLLMNFLLFISCVTYGQKANYIKLDFEGYVFEKNHFVFVSVNDMESRYTPSTDDIMIAERILKDSLSYLRQHQVIYGGPIIYKNLENYVRQYVGCVTKERDKIIFINFVWKNQVSLNRLSEDIYYVLDGGSYYWSICINITRRRLFNMEVNGVS